MTSRTELSSDAATTPDVTVAELAAAGEQPGWRVLDTARSKQFTGEIVFDVQPAISVFFDGGFAYHAVRAGDPSLCERLIEADVVEPAQVERGVIRVGNVENLGRLFDRDSSIDRDAVMVVLELATDEVVTTIANTVSGSFSFTAYRHHASGVHRWFVAPSGDADQPPAQLTPVGAVAQIDTSVTTDLPVVGAPADDGVEIEWAESLHSKGGPTAQPLHSLDDDFLQSLLDDSPTVSALEPTAAPASTPEPEPFSPARAEVRPPEPIAPEPVTFEPVTFEPVIPEAAAVIPVPEPTVSVEELVEVSTPENFQIVWPDGSEQTLDDDDVADDQGSDVDADPSAVAAPEPGLLADPVDLPPTPPVSIAAPAESLVDVVAAEIVPAAPEALSFDMPPLALTGDNVPEEQQPEEVVDAVRRALDAIETASAAPTGLPAVEVGTLPSFEPAKPLEFDVADPLTGSALDTHDPHSNAATTDMSALEAVLRAEPTAPADVAAVEVQPTAAPAAFGGFAPPTMNDSAEAVYARAAHVEVAQAAPASGAASVVLVDEEPDGDDRSGALKRLIGSLRRK